MDHPAFHPSFLYSHCTGRKKALCIGVNYRGEPHELRGCINDAKDMRRFLIKHHGYKSEDIVLLTDDNPNPRSQPTRRNMIEAMRWLVQSARCHDSLFFHYSGHGGQTKDLDGDEVDGMDEVIYPVDFQQKGHILDDDLFKIMVRPLPAGCRLTHPYLQSCHSGTVLDLPFIYSASSRLRGSHVSQRARARRSSPADVISFSACKDGQKSTDTFKGGVAVGAMSWVARNPNQTYQHILKEVYNMTYPKYHQTPQLGSSHHIVCCF
ncbi:peptidase C14, caspase domain-containing protein [Lentinula lateritia]|uniref:Peptidase C14, caspase domain-containing protein n=1 Tax=Lentinula aff. lateritia TaxID=2804960 RepID=A0ACC1TVC5_9AGAR|nr:peptidase C14, caspase domain-containing protein [Lentinula aff. lateritia]KAJ3848779.1 peptidase C14, caspase domain-containing protein [Lentinula lateritia]